MKPITVFTTLSLLFLTINLRLTDAARPPLKITKCKPRSIEVRFKASKAPVIRLYRACSYKSGPGSESTVNCGTFEKRIFAGCTKIFCSDGSKCNYCRFSIRKSDVPRFYHNLNGTTPELGSYYVQLHGDGLCYENVVEFSSDFGDSGEDWFERNRFTTTCDDRVSCNQWNENCWPWSEPPFDLSFYAQACDAKMHYVGSPTARTAKDCFNGNVLPSSTVGQVNGVDCPPRLI